MNLNPFNQTELFGLDKFFNEIIKLDELNIMPNKIILSGPKGTGKSTLAIHVINKILSNNEDYPYDVKNFKINEKNRSYKLILNKSSPNFYHVDLKDDKKNIDIKQIRDLINFCNKSSFNNKPRFILIDNVEFLNLNSSNALLKVLEEPNDNIYFILINNGKNILPTIKSRCINFNINLTFKESISIFNKIIKEDIFLHINKDLINYYFTTGNLINLYKFSKESNINLSELDLKNFLLEIINGNYYKKDTQIKDLIYELIQIFYLKKIKLNQDYDDYLSYVHFVNDVKKNNLDNENIFIKLKPKLIDG